jgi:3-hydroxybutyryl-CoA dehydratase
VSGGGTTRSDLEPAGLPQVGAAFMSRTRTIEQTEITLFSALTGDWHPQHCDAVWAESSIFGERIAHGLLVLSLASGLLTWDHDRVIALRSVREVKFRSPVRIGDTVQVDAQVRRVRALKTGLAIVEMSWRVLNQLGTTILTARVELLWRCSDRDGGAADAD